MARLGNLNGDLERWCERFYRPLSIACLALAVFNLGFRLDQEVVTTWDESLYATTAAEIVKSGQWIGTTFHGALDYYNAKPPLNVWLIAVSFKLFGLNLWSLRLASAFATWVTVAVLQSWARRVFGSAVAILSSVVLGTTFAFLYVHSGRSANPDALLALVVLLTVTTLWRASEQPWRLVWLGPLLAAAFLLKGMAVLMPLSIVVAVCGWRGIIAAARMPLLSATLAFAAPIAGWVVARMNVDRGTFFRPLFRVDFISGVTTALDGHKGSPFYYLDVLQRDQYDWLVATLLVWLLLYPTARTVLSVGARHRSSVDLRVLLASWLAATLIIPTLMSTKLAWYLNPFYPVFALGIGLAVSRSWTGNGTGVARWRRVGAIAVLGCAIVVAESKLLWYSYHKRDLQSSVQGMLLAEKVRLRGRRVYRSDWQYGDQLLALT